LINAAAVNNVQDLVDDAVEKGAQVRTGGKRMSGAGYFYPPTVLDKVPFSARLLREEIFGPVAPIVEFDDENEAVALANDTPYGLAAYLYTGDLKRGLKVTEKLEAGMIGLNRGMISDPGAPFGGVKQSGLGREGAHEGMMEYLERKYVAVEW
jgi:succinate-semialdehyde dehydrogenase/glutarate-semialdehyde dehydrogenase